ncbi:MAG: type II toxin-antitoxin system VapC family toxin [Firmicutes bacterium]|nr:type II toxin-antitoxin system VapC family toxin [Bacillota bacterium]
MSPRRFVFDSYAVLALMEDEPGAQRVAEIIADEAAELYLCVINLGEIYYVIARREGEPAAEEVVRGVMEEESLVLAEATWPRVKEAARIKAGGGLSYADAFVLALSLEIGAPLVTGDPEIRAAAGRLGVEVVWIGGS